MKIQVKQEHVDLAIKLRSEGYLDLNEFCPIALAVKELEGIDPLVEDRVMVDADEVGYWEEYEDEGEDVYFKKEKWIELPEEARGFIVAFDNFVCEEKGECPGPLEFEVGEPWMNLED